MITYVCAIAFNKHQDQVVLMKKLHGPPCNLGCWNGPGGKVNSGETIPGAMCREFKEETGVQINEDSWREFARAWHEKSQARIHFMTATTDGILKCKTVEKEPILLAPIDQIRERGLLMAENLYWLIELAHGDSSALLVQFELKDTPARTLSDEDQALLKAPTAK